MHILLTTLIFSIVVTLGVAYRTGMRHYYQWWVIASLCFFVSMFAFGFTYMVWSQLRNYACGEKCTGTVVDYEVSASEDGDTYSSLIEFMLPSGEVRRKTPNFLPGSEEKGDTVVLYYNNRDHSISVYSPKILFCLALLVHVTLLLDLIIAGILLFVLGVSKQIIHSIIAHLVYYFLAPSFLFVSAFGCYYMAWEILSASKSTELFIKIYYLIPIAVGLSIALLYYIKRMVTKAGVPPWMLGVIPRPVTNQASDCLS